MKQTLGLDVSVMRQLLLTALVLAFTATAFAVRVTSLYQFEISVVSQADDVRMQAVREGFLGVLIKVSGDPQIANNPTIKSYLDNAGYYVQEFSYYSPPMSPFFILKIHYDRNDINRLLRKAGVAYWGDNRPLILAWIAFTNDKHYAEIIGNETPGDIITTMKQEANKNGLPLIFPIMDMTDINEVSASDIDGMSIKILKDAAKRYAPDALLIGAIQQNDIDYKSKWQLIVGNNKWEFELADRLLTGLMSSVIKEVNHTLAKYYVEKAASEPQWIKLEVSNISKRDDLVQLMRYLKQLSAVQQVQLSQVMGDVVDISILLRGSITSFQENAAIGQKLILKSQDDTNNKLIYEWTH